MKSKASLLLMEQLIMILVFALAAVLCLQAFVGADQTARTTLRQDQAVLLAQNGAETLKACGGDLEKAAGLLGGTWEDDTMTVSFEELRMEVTLLPSEVPGLGQAQIHVGEGEAILFSLIAAWQEVDG